MADGPDAEKSGRMGRLFAALVGDPSAVDASPVRGCAPDAAPKPSALDMEELSRGLGRADDPLAYLRDFVSDVRRRESAAQGPAGEKPLRAADASQAAPGAVGQADPVSDGAADVVAGSGTDDAGRGSESAAGPATGPAAGNAAPAPCPSAFELHLARRLEDAGLIAGDDSSLPRVRAVRPRTSDTFYLRIEDPKLSYGNKLLVLSVEAALNDALLVERAVPDANATGADRLMQASQRVLRSVTAQASRMALRLEGPAEGEWDVRHALSLGIESFQLPWRLSCRFRVNVGRGAAAFEVDLTPAQAWPRSCFVEGLGIVDATPEMRRRAAADYNLRLAVLIAGFAFAAAPELTDVWVAGVVDTSTDHSCYYSVRIPRAALDGVDLDGCPDPLALMRACGAAVDDLSDGLLPVRQGFSLEDELFCPPSRWDPPELSHAPLQVGYAQALGCTEISDLGIDEACRRKHVAAELVRGLGSSTEANVRAILAAGSMDPHEDVRASAMRCVQKLIDGSLADDPDAIEEAFVSGSDLAAQVDVARRLFLSQDIDGASQRVLAALEPVDRIGRYTDEWPVTWRAFGNYVDRALYNRLLGQPGEDARLVSAPYFEAHMLASVTALVRGRNDEALVHARRAVQLAPLSAQASLHLSSCLEAAGDRQAAADELRRLLSLAHDPESMGLGYLRMAQVQWQSGNVLAAQACVQRAGRHLGASALVAGLTVVALTGQVTESAMGGLPSEQVDAVLTSAKIPLAPTHEVTEAFFEAARAATDAQIFAAARDFLQTLAQVSRDDVYFGMLRSLEDEPDR